MSKTESMMQKCNHDGCNVFTAKEILGVADIIHYTPENWNCGKHPEDHIIRKYQVMVEVEYVNPEEREIITKLFDEFYDKIATAPRFEKHAIRGGDHNVKEVGQ